MTMKHKVFVYGTLKAGYCNHYLLQGKIAQPAIALQIQLHAGPDYPFAIRGQGNAHGEVYEIDEITLQALDQLEQEHDDYYRELTPVILDTQQEIMAWIYLNYKAFRYPCLPNGVWCHSSKSQFEIVATM